MAPPTTAVTDRRLLLARRIRILVATTIGYNVAEAVVALTAGAAAASPALTGFGLDSVVEVCSAAVVAWQFSGKDPQAREKTALRLISLCFFALALYVGAQSALSLLGLGEPRPSPVGIGLAAASLVVMPTLSLLQRRAGREAGSRSAVADSGQSLLCAYLSGVLLIGLVLNSQLGWGWADPIAALAIAAVALRNGIHTRRGDACC